MEDIAPTLLDLVRVPSDPLSATGRSLAPLLRGAPGVTRVGSAERVRFTETDLRVLPNTKGEVDEIETAEAELEILRGKQRDWADERAVEPSCRCRSRTKSERRSRTRLLLAALPAGPDAHQYLLLDRGQAATDACCWKRRSRSRQQERRLWDALAAEHGDLLKRPVSITEGGLAPYRIPVGSVLRDACSPRQDGRRRAVNERLTILGGVDLNRELYSAATRLAPTSS